MTNFILDKEKKQFIEDVGIIFEESGLPRMAGRVLGWLLICVPTHQSATELGLVVGASKGSISTTMRMLMASGLVERMGIPGERSAYFRIKPGSWSGHLRSRSVRMSQLRKLAERGLDLMTGAEAKYRERLEKMRDIYAFFEAEFPALLDKYEKKIKGGDQ